MSYAAMDEWNEWIEWINRMGSILKIFLVRLFLILQISFKYNLFLKTIMNIR